MNEIIIREAVPGDLETLLAFEQGIAAAERPMDSTLKEGEIHYYDLRQLISAENVHLVVAALDGEMVGSGYAQIRDAKGYLKHRQYAHLGFMYVRPQHRGKGINQLILDALKQWCREREIFELRLEVYDTNTPAIRAYEKAGFTKNLVEMRIDLNDKS
jgi:GNAT superfamily N-acetyltransferase